MCFVHKQTLTISLCSLFSQSFTKNAQMMEYKTANFCCCPCTQVVAWDPIGGLPTPVVGDSVTQTGGGSGIIISITGSGSGLTAIIRLDDCNKPFTSGGIANLFVNGTAQGTDPTGGVTAQPKNVQDCTIYPGRRRDYPQDPQDNPKNYNKSSIN